MKSCSGFAPTLSGLVVNWLLPNLFAAHAAAYQFTEGNRHIYCMGLRLPCQQDNTFAFTAFEKRENERINSMKGIFQMCRPYQSASG